MLSIVIPVYNEHESLERLLGELDEVARAHDYELEVIFVDDGSTDGSWSVIEQLAERDARVRGIKFRRNFGKTAALSAGFQAADGDEVITLDADLQDDPAEIPRFLEALDGGLDLVSGWKQVRHDPWHKVAASRVFNFLVRRLTGVLLHDQNCGMKAYRREVLGESRLYGELHRFAPVLPAARGVAIGEIPVHDRARQYGRSKYGVGRLLRGFLDLLTVTVLTGYGHRPHHLLGAIGLVSCLVGAVGLISLAGFWTAAQLFPEWDLDPLHQRPAVIYSVGALLLGGQLMSIGFLAEMIAAYQHRDTDVYSIAKRTGCPPKEDTPPT